MNEQRAREFARCAVVLAAGLPKQFHYDPTPAAPEPRLNPFDPAPSGDDLFAPAMAGREGIFDQGLSNGLAAIVASEWPGEEASKGRVLSASALLKVVQGHVTAADGVCLIPDRHPAAEISPQETTSGTGSIFNAPSRPMSRHTRVDISTLQEGIEASQLARHGRGEGGLRLRHIAALLALDGHESLGMMGEEQQDRLWGAAVREDAASRARAAEYLERIGDDEAARRAEHVENPNAYHPKRNPDGHDLDSCPVCGFEAFVVEGLVVIGDPVGYGQCLVCTYTRTSDAAENEAFADHCASIMSE
ncbi:hypothetical protein [Streptomyces sp. NBC_01174]|uniref:hypothetical protein n=1 Tax=Streptomyces sp. NBC_01174 TaxID=2903758 RepID=UPI002F913414|nr:hypothetical protein OG414_40470 [Streptomyces sp. NBC_01174]